MRLGPAKMSGVETAHPSAPTAPAAPAIAGMATGTTRIRASREWRAWPLLPLAPGVVILVGVAVGLAMGLFGVNNLASASDDHAAERADLLASTLASRVAQLPPTERLEAMQRAARKTGAEFVVVSRAGEIVLDASLGMANRAALRRVVGVISGEAITGLGRTRFAT